MVYKILIVEDDAGIAQAIAQRAAAWGFEARCVQDFRNVSEEFTDFSPQLVLLDIMLPFYNGYYWCSELRKVSNLPIIFLSSASDNMNIVMAMNMGADDFIAKPFDMEVLILKIQALLRRSYDFCVQAPFLEHRGAVLNTADQTLSVDNRKLELTKNEYRILLVLLKDKGKVVSREKLMEELWESESFVDENTLTVNINRLRKKLAAAGLEGFIATKFGVGYRIA
ncbi:MAG: response regulator transcription factor [Lachnospiraceae bacterium]|nr:response regulator transcription factor [Lachnospiraceae bacterium]